MAHRHDSGQKPRKQGKRAGARRQVLAPDEVEHYPHRVFGAIPMIEVSVTQPDGTTRVSRDFDPDYAPALPKGGVRGDVRKQEFCRMCHVPKYFYVDMPRRCVQCGVDFVFAAVEQKRWYESLKFHFDSVPVRCLTCRRKRRSDGELRAQLREARAAVSKTPDSASAQLGLAEALARCHERLQEGRLTDGIAAARRARRLLRGHSQRERSEADFWEALCHALTGNRQRAEPLLRAFLEAGPSGKRGVTLRAEAQAWLEDL